MPRPDKQTRSVPRTPEEAQRVFDDLRRHIVDQGVHPDLATIAARRKIEARPFA